MVARTLLHVTLYVHCLSVEFHLRNTKFLSFIFQDSNVLDISRFQWLIVADGQIT